MAQVGSNDEKNWRSKISWTVPLQEHFHKAREGGKGQDSQVVAYGTCSCTIHNEQSVGVVIQHTVPVTTGIIYTYSYIFE